MQGRRWRGLITLGLWLLVLLLAVRFALFTLKAAVRHSHGFVAYYTAARLLRDGAEVHHFYDDSWFHAQMRRYGLPADDIYSAGNPPTTSLLMLPLAGLNYTSARLVWTIVSLLCLAGAVIWLLLQLRLRGLLLPGAIALVLLYQPLYANFWHGQVYVCMLALLVVAWQADRRNQPALLGLVLGLLLVFKLAGILIWPLLLVQRRWRALAWGAGSVLALVLGSLPWIGLQAWERYLVELGRLNGHPARAVTAYQSLLGLVRHLLTFDAQWNPAPLLLLPSLGAWLPWLGFVAMAGLSLYRAVSARQSDLAFAACLLASLILSPLSLDYHYTLLLLPVLLLIARVHQLARWQTFSLMAGVTLIAAPLPYQTPQLAAGAWALLAYPKLYGALLLWGLCLRGDQPALPASNALVARRARLRRRALLVCGSAAQALLLPALSPLASLLVVRLASAELWGQYVQQLLLIQLAVHIIGWGNKEYLLRRFSKRPAHLGFDWRSSLLSRLGLLLLLWLLLWGLDLPGAQRRLLMVWSSALVLAQAHEVLVVYNRDFSFAALVEAAALLGTLLAIVAYGPALELEHLLVVAMLMQLLKAAALLLRFQRQTLRDANRRVDLSVRLSLSPLRQALPFFLIGLGGMLQSRMDLYCVSLLLPGREVAFYQILLSLVILVQTLAHVLLQPFLRGLYRLSPQAVARISARLGLIGLGLILPALALLELLLTRLYHFSVSPLLLLLAGLLILPIYIYTPLIYALFRQGREQLVVVLCFAGAGMSLGLNLLLLPKLGLSGALLASVIAHWMVLALLLLQSSSAARQPGTAYPREVAP